jgi:signal transduction histidine kinase
VDAGERPEGEPVETDSRPRAENDSPPPATATVEDDVSARLPQAEAKQTLANLAHELRTPLQVLVGYLDILREDWGGELQPAPREILERMNRNLQELVQLVNNVLNFLRFDCLAPPADGGEEIVLAELLAEIMPAIQAFNHARGLELVFDLEAAPPVIRAPRRALRTILVNLLHNAIKFTARGRVSLTAEQVASGDGAGEVLFRITDTGPGMGTQALKHLAQPFRQLSQSNARRFRGLGLGLAVTQRELRLLGGRLEVTACPGQGASFTARLPLASLPAQGAMAGHLGCRAGCQLLFVKGGLNPGRPICRGS